MRDFPTLYKMTSTGAIQQWNIVVVPKGEGSPYYVVTFGQKDGAQQSKKSSRIEGKNKGRANETAPLEQCILEAKSKWIKQRDRKGYTEAIPTSRPVLPMLAKVYNDFKHKVVFPASIAPKLDGMRALWDGSRLFTRKGDKIKPMGWLEEKLAAICPQEIILDGELWIKGVEFQEIVSAVKRDNPNWLTPKIQYWVYDCIVKNDHSAPYSKRREILEKLDWSADATNLLPELIIGSHEEAAQIFDKHISEGYEGSIIRNLGAKYKINGRSHDLLKLKSFIDQEFKIVGAKEGRNSFEGMCIFVCECNGTTFDVMPKGSEEQRREFLRQWKSGEIKEGDMLTVEFFEWTTSDPPKPRFPVGKAIRRD